MASPNVIHLSDADFQTQVVESEVPVLIDLTAVWCGPCKAIAPLIDQLADAQKGKLKVCKLDIDHNPEVPNNFGVQSIPTLLLFKGGKLVDRRVGAMSKAALENWVAPVLA